MGGSGEWRAGDVPSSPEVRIDVRWAGPDVSPQQSLAREIVALAPDVVIPMHCTGRNFIAKMRAEMPDRLIDWNTGSRFTFGV